MAEDTYHDGDGLSMEGGGPSGGGDANHEEASDDQHQEEEGLGWLGDEESSSDDEGDFKDSLSEFEEEEEDEEEEEEREEGEGEEEEEEEGGRSRAQTYDADDKVVKLGAKAAWYKARCNQPLYCRSSGSSSGDSGGDGGNNSSGSSGEDGGDGGSNSSSSSGSRSSSNSGGGDIEGDSRDSSNSGGGDSSDARLTVLEAIFFFLTFKQKHRIGTTAFNELLKFLTEVLLPRGNFLPPSEHLMRAVIGCKDWSEYEQHVCDRDGCQGVFIYASHFPASQ